MLPLLSPLDHPNPWSDSDNDSDQDSSADHQPGGNLDLLSIHPPPNLFLSAKEIFGPQLSNRLVLMAWDAVVAQERQRPAPIILNDQQALVQSTLSYLIDHPASFPQPPPPPPLGIPSGSRQQVPGPGPRPLASLYHPFLMFPLNPIASTSAPRHQDPHPFLPRARKQPLEDDPDIRTGHKDPIIGAAAGQHENPRAFDLRAVKRFRADDQADDPLIQAKGPPKSNTPAEAEADAEADADANPAPPAAEALAQILSIVPDVATEHAATLFLSLGEEDTQEARVNMVVNQLLEAGSYPKSAPPAAPRQNSNDVKGKGRQATPNSSANKVAAEDESFQTGLAKWTSVDRNPKGPGANRDVAARILSNDFRLLPMDHIRRVVQKKVFLVPSWIALDADLKKPENEVTFRMLKAKRPAKPHVAVQIQHALYAEFRSEYEWLCQHKQKLKTTQDHQAEEQLLEEQERQEGLLIECQCCYDTFRFIKMIQCPDGHLFCPDCIKRCVEVQIGNNQAKIQCMDGSGCEEQFTRSELTKVLSERLLSKLEQIAFEDSLDSAMIDGLEKCPFCPWAVIIENPAERLFRCCNEECSKVSCRLCKKPDHIPKTCEEAKLDEEKENYLHHVAEAMTEALIRRCPSCQRGFVKENGCNKIRCSHCFTLSCYICQQVVTGYEHFANTGPNAQGSAANAKATCPLWDNTDVRHHEEITKAHQAAAIEVQKQNARVTEDDLARFGPGQRPPDRVPGQLMGLGRGPGLR